MNTERDPGPPLSLPSDVCLQFVNTRLWRRSPHPTELLGSYADLVAWSQGRRIVSDAQGESLQGLASSRPAEARAVYERAIRLREALYRVFEAVARAGVVEPSDLESLNEVLAEAMARARVTQGAAGFRWDWTGAEDALERMLWPVARSAAALLVSAERDRVKQCPGPQCGWFFIDTSRNRSRRWCTTRLCGNRERVQQHYRRKRSASPAADRTHG